MIYMNYWPSVRSRWLDIGQKGTRLIFNHVDLTNLVNKGYVVWTLMNLPRLRGNFFLPDTARNLEQAT